MTQGALVSRPTMRCRHWPSRKPGASWGRRSPTSDCRLAMRRSPINTRGTTGQVTRIPIVPWPTPSAPSCRSLIGWPATAIKKTGQTAIGRSRRGTWPRWPRWRRNEPNQVLRLRNRAGVRGPGPRDQARALPRLLAEAPRGRHRGAVQGAPAYRASGGRAVQGREVEAMDPNTTLAEIRQIILRAEELEAQDKSLFADASDRLVELVRDLDEWLSRGGALPRAWKDPYPRAAI